MERLGVGKNMVASIRHWCEVMDLAESDGRSRTTQASELGHALFARGGWDPYLEDPGTLWLLHWQLAEAAERASTWHLAFTRWHKDTFTRDELADWLISLSANASALRSSSGTIRRDVDTFLRTYVSSPSVGTRAAEESFDSPLVELGLIRELDSGVYQFNRGPKPTLPVEVFSYALARYWERTASHQGTLSLERVLYGPGSPGAAFLLSEAAGVALVEQLPASTGLRYDETAGLRLVLRTKVSRVEAPHALLESYYRRQGKEWAL
jgi:hypothetical protein